MTFITIIFFLIIFRNDTYYLVKNQKEIKKEKAGRKERRSIAINARK